MSLSPGVFRVGTVSSSKRLSELDILDAHGNVVSVDPDGGWQSIRGCESVSIHIIVTGASSANMNLSAFTSNINPNNNDHNDLTISGARYDGGSSDVPFTANGEYMLDIVETAAGFIDPYIEVTAGSANIVFIIAGKS